MRGKATPPPIQEMPLNVSSLMDILTILLLFLILSFGSQEQDVAPPKGLTLPDSVSEQPIKLAVAVSISETEIAVEDTVVLALGPGQRLAGGTLDAKRRIKPLFDELRKQRARLQSGAAQQRGLEGEAEIIYLQAAKGTPFALLDMVLKTAAEAGFAKFRLAVHRRT